MSMYPVRRPMTRAAAMAAGGLLLSGVALAQVGSPACERFKASLATRLHADPSTYTLDSIPAGMAVPKGAKVVGNCDGGTVKVVFRRGKLPPLDVASLTPAPAPAAAVAATPATPAAPASSTAPAAPPPRATAPPPTRPTATATATATAAAPASARAPAPAFSASSTAMAPATADAPPADGAAPATDPAEPADGPALAWTDRLEPHWPWALLVLAPLVFWAGAWLRHRRHYDAAGLPRGPRL